MGGGDPRRKRLRLAAFWSASGEPSALSGWQAQAPGGSGEGEQEGMHRFLRRRNKEKEAQASFLRALLWLRNPHPRVGECRGRGKLRALLGGQAAQSKAILVTAPPTTRHACGCQVSCLEVKPAKSSKAKRGGGKSGPGGPGGPGGGTNTPTRA